MKTTTTTTGMTIGGEAAYASDGGVIEAVNPATGENIGTFPAATREDVDKAAAAAGSAFAVWRKTEPEQRARALLDLARIIEEHQEELAALDVADNGSPIREMRNDTKIAVEQLCYFAGLVHQVRGETIPTSYDRINYTLQQPYGVVARIIPFNHPLMFAAAKIAAPIAAGNTVILKPSEHTSLSALRLGELSRGILPDGVLNVVTGYGHTAGDALVRHPDIRRLAFIGASDTGRSILAASASTNLKNVTLELGGKNPLVIFPDADLDKAVLAAQRGMNFTWQGQSCGSTSRLLIHRSIYEEFLDVLTAAVGTMRQGPPADDETETGSLVNAAQFEKVKHYLGMGKAQGARVMAGGARLKGGGFDKGFFVPPTVFADVEPTSPLAMEEVFGPVLVAMPFDSYHEAISIANSVKYGLTASVFTQELRTAHKFARDIEAGYVWVNEVSRHFSATAYGGQKDSGLGREEGIEELFSYTQSKNVHINFEH